MSEKSMRNSRLPGRTIVGMVCAVVCLTAISLQAEDWPQWRGADRDGRSGGAPTGTACGATPASSSASPTTVCS